MYLSIGQAAQITGLSISTLRRWDAENKFTSCYVTKGGHRRYLLEKIERELLNKVDTSSNTRRAVAYARVSTHDQKLDLLRQESRLEEYCKNKEIAYEIISDLGSGINYNKKGLTKLIKKICSYQVSELILTHKDRLLRFGSALLFKLCEFYGTKVVILESEVANVIEIMTVFTAKMYGRRAYKNKKALETKAC